MSVAAPPPPPPGIGPPSRRGPAPIVDRRRDYARTTPQTAADRARTAAFIDAKIETVRRDPTLSEAEKAAAIAALEAYR